MSVFAMVDDTRLELVTSRTSSGCATSCANRPSAWIEYTRFAALSSPFPGKCEKIFYAIALGEPCAGTRGRAVEGASPYEGDEGRREGQAPPLRGDVPLLRRGRRPRRPVARRRARVGGRFMNRPYGKQGIRIATATPPSPAPPPPQCAHWGTSPGGGGKIRRRHLPFQGRQGGAGLQGKQAGGQRLPLRGTKDGLSRAPAPTQRIPPFP